MLVTALYAAVLALLFFGLSVRTLRLRRRLRIPVGDGGNEAMLRAMRVHANFAEYVPISLLLIFLLEAVVAAAWPIHVLGLCLLLGRCAHAYGVRAPREDYRYRVFGMTMTFVALVGAALGLLATHLWRLL